MVYLNFDIYEKIIEDLADDIKTLKCCSLVCTAFCLLSRKHIFCKIDLKVYHDWQTSAYRSQMSLGRLLDGSPLIANHVHTFRYIIDYQVKRNPRIPQGFNRVHTFALKFKRGPRYWTTDLSNNFKFSLNFFIRSNSIVDLSLFNINNVPVTILLHFPCLKVLDLQCVSLCDDPLPRFFGIPGRPPKLVEFRSHDTNLGPLRKFLECDRSSARSRPILDMTNLENIALLVEDSYACIDITIILIKASQKLKSLTLTGYRSELPLEGRLASNLSEASLRSLTSIAISPVLYYIHDDPYLHLITELEQLRGQNVLEKLYIYVQVQTDCSRTTELSRWAPLDTVFSPRRDFPFLRELTLGIVIYDFSGYSGKLRAQLEEIGRTAFPWLTANKDFVFEFQVEVEDI